MMRRASDRLDSTGVGRDKACFKNRFHSSRSFTLVP